MNRRSFLQLIGATAAVAATGPAKLLAATPKLPETLVTHYSLLQTRHGLGQYVVAGLVLPAPAGKRCRAVLEVSNAAKGVFVYPRSAMVFNEPDEIVLTAVKRAIELPDDLGPNMLMSELDAAVLNYEGVPIPVDWGLIARDKSLVLDYRGLQETDAALYLALHYSVHDEGYTHQCGLYGAMPGNHPLPRIGPFSSDEWD